MTTDRFETLILKIKTTVYELMQYRIDNFLENASELVDEMFNVFPEIIALYGDVRMSDLSDDATYWPAQLERIVNTLQSADDFAIADVLYNETLPNLEELKGILTERGVL